MQLITDFSNLANQQWKIVNDSVMGGNSSSQFQINEDGNGVFLGRISLANNGGFASVKNYESLNLYGCRSVWLRLKGDGKRYSFRFQTRENGNVNDWSYKQLFKTVAQSMIEIHLPLNRFIATYRGRILDDVPELNPEAIARYGFLISEQQEGNFRLEIEKIWAI